MRFPRRARESSSTPIRYIVLGTITELLIDMITFILYDHPFVFLSCGASTSNEHLAASATSLTETIGGGTLSRVHAQARMNVPDLHKKQCLMPRCLQHTLFLYSMYSLSIWLCTHCIALKCACKFLFISIRDQILQMSSDLSTPASTWRCTLAVMDIAEYIGMRVAARDSMTV